MHGRGPEVHPDARAVRFNAESQTLDGAKGLSWELKAEIDLYLELLFAYVFTKNSTNKGDIPR